MASVYDEAFPTGYASAVERHAIALFVDEVASGRVSGSVLDVGCGTGHITNDLRSRGLDVLGIDPSAAMLTLARRRYPEMRWCLGDASLGALPEDDLPIAGILARFSLIHVDPGSVPGIFRTWVARLQPGAHVMVAFQCSEDPAGSALEFAHVVAPAWRWHPDAMAAALAEAGLSERWRLVTQPDDSYRFPTCHLVSRLA